MNKAFGFGVAATMVIGGAASADVLYDNPVGAGGTAVNQEFGDFPTYSTYLVADFNVPNPGFTLTSVAAPMTVNGAWAAVTTARLHLFPVTGNLPAGGDDPAASVIVVVSYNVQTGVLSTVGLNMDVVAGDYWIGLTGIGDFGAVGQAFTLEGANANGNPDAAINPGGSFNFPAGTDWFAIQTFVEWGWHDFALTVQGDPLAAKCPWDLDGGGFVGAGDLLLLLASWGNPYGAADLLDLLAAWGACPGAVDCKGQECGTYTFDCNPNNPDCVCYTSPDGAFCGPGVPCDAEPCDADSDCPPGFRCAILTCCGDAGICIPECEAGIAVPKPPAGVRTSNGR